MATNNRYLNKLLNGGCVDVGAAEPFCGVLNDGNDTDGLLKSRCTRVQADYAFQFIACAFALGTLVLGFLLSKRSGKAVFA